MRIWLHADKVKISANGSLLPGWLGFLAGWGLLQIDGSWLENLHVCGAEYELCVSGVTKYGVIFFLDHSVRTLSRVSFWKAKEHRPAKCPNPIFQKPYLNTIWQSRHIDIAVSPSLFSSSVFLSMLKFSLTSLSLTKWKHLMTAFSNSLDVCEEKQRVAGEMRQAS